MKKLILLLTILLTNHYAQAQFGFGPEVGVGGSNMRYIPNSTFTSSGTSGMFAGKVGAMIDVPFSQHLYFQSGLSFSRKGGTNNYSFHLSDSTHDAESMQLSLNYIDLPLNMVYKTRSQGKGRAFLGIGAQMSYLVGGSAKLKAQGAYNDTAFNLSQTTTPDKVVRKFDIAASFYVGYELPTGLYFKVYYLSGVKDLGLYSDVMKNRMWGIGAGYIFGKNRNINKDPEGLIEK